jgi:hypothetical protein
MEMDFVCLVMRSTNSFMRLTRGTLLPKGAIQTLNFRLQRRRQTSDILSSLCEWAVTGQVNCKNGLSHVVKFFAHNKRLIKGNFQFVHKLFLNPDAQERSSYRKGYAISKYGPFQIADLLKDRIQSCRNL